MSDPTIRLPSCRGDGRCPECGEDARGSSALACGCRVPNALCVMRHLSALLTEALRQKEGAEAGAALAMQTLTEAVEKCDVAYFKGVRSVLMIRCMAHREVAVFNATEAAGGECAACAVEALREERDAAIRENVAADQRGWERAISAVRFALADYPHAGLASEIGAQVERIVAKKTESAIRERDEARAEALKWRRIRTPMHGSCCTCQGCGLAYESCRCSLDEVCDRADRAEALLAEARAEHRDISQRYIAASSARIRAEALLRECLAVLVALPGNTSADSVPALIAKIWEAVK